MIMTPEALKVSRRSLLAGAAATLACAEVSMGDEPKPAVTPLSKPKKSDVIPDLEVVDHRGRKAKFYTDLVRNRAVVLNFMYVNCEGSCPGTSALLKTLRPEFTRILGRDALMLSITLDPENDNPDVLAAYAKLYSKPGDEREFCDWRFLTGGRETIEKLRRALGYWDPNPRIDNDRSQHAALLTFGNDQTDRWTSQPVGISERQMLRSIARIAGRDAKKG